MEKEKQQCNKCNIELDSDIQYCPECGDMLLLQSTHKELHTPESSILSRTKTALSREIYLLHTCIVCITALTIFFVPLLNKNSIRKSESDTYRKCAEYVATVTTEYWIQEDNLYKRCLRSEGINSNLTIK